MNNQVLFLGITNFCASRFAEILFNQMASEQLLKYQGFSRGVLLKHQQNNLDPRCIEALDVRGVPLPANFRKPTPLKSPDLENAACIVLINPDLEHRIQRSDKIEDQQILVWDFKDVNSATPAALFPALEAEVHLLIRRLQQTPLVDPQSRPAFNQVTG